MLLLGIERTEAASPIEDIALNPTGTLEGRIAGDQHGQLSRSMMVQLYRDGKPIAQTRLDSEGHFHFSGLQSGIYRLEWAHSERARYTKFVRLWDHGQTPPSAKSQLMLISDAPMVVRGQYGNPNPGNETSPTGSMRRIFRNPWITAAIISTAVAVPIAVAYKNPDSS